MSTPIETAAEALNQSVGFRWSDDPEAYRKAEARNALASLAQHRDDFARKVLTADIDWEGRDTSSWDRAQSVVDAVLAYLTEEPS